MAKSDEAAMSVLKNFIGAKASRGIHIEAAGHRRLDLGIGSPRGQASPHLGDGLVGRKAEVSAESPEQAREAGVRARRAAARAGASLAVERRAQRSGERRERGLRCSSG